MLTALEVHLSSWLPGQPLKGTTAFQSQQAPVLHMGENEAAGVVHGVPLWHSRVQNAKI